jgi:hypothetical protein
MILIYQSIKELLAVVTDLEEVEWFTGQFDQDGDDATAVSTGAYIQFSPVQWQQMGGGVQSSVFDTTIHVVSEDLGRGDTRIEQHLALVIKVYIALQQKSVRLSDLLANPPVIDAVIINSMVRKSTTTNHTLSNLQVTAMSFETYGFDISAVPTLQDLLAGLLLNTQYS